MQTESRARWRQIGIAALLVLLVGALYFTTLRWLMTEWFSNDYYSHGPLVVLISAFFIWRWRDALGRAPANWGLAGVVAALAGHFAGLAMRAPYISALTLPLFAGGLVAFIWGLPALRRLAFPLAFFWLAVPLPFVEAASVPLQTITASVSSAIAVVLGIPAKVQGAQVSLSTCDLVIGAPCSGLRSVVSLLTLVLLFAYVMQGPRAGRLLLVALAVPLAIVANIVRITALLVIADTWGQDAALTYFHDYSSPVLFVCAFALLILLSWTLRCREIRPDILA